MRSAVIMFAFVGFVLLAGCATRHGLADTRAHGKFQSIYTSLNVSSCRKAIDASDPNETPYWICPGVGGYTLQIRQVESARLSINVVDPAKQQFPLKYQDVVTRSMSSLGDTAEWRIRREAGKPIPLALIVRVIAREDPNDPERITSTYFAVAKIAADGVCVTDRVRQGTKPVTELRALADSSGTRPCASPLPLTAAVEIR